MAGLYIHIPYCKTICNYCDFYKTATTRTTEDFVAAIVKEIEIKKNLLNQKISSIYFGGGTPSFLAIQKIEIILSAIEHNYSLAEDCEKTIEVNPDDVLLDYFHRLIGLGFNRLSIGIQSFNNEILQFLNRRHSSEAAIKSIEFAQIAGFRNISIDLIYGIPTQTLEMFSTDLKQVINFEIVHLSAYHLGIEENTYFGKLKKNGKINEIEETKSEQFFNLLNQWSFHNKFEHYEVSNLAKDKLYSRHNMAYWFSAPYLGFGPSAHSFVNNKRLFNVSNLNHYIKHLTHNEIYSESEDLSELDKLNEYLMLRLRTQWGFNLIEFQNRFSHHNLKAIMRSILKFQETNYLRIENDQVCLTNKSYFISDYIIRDLITCN